jgi:Flp pilus assembly protein TadG
VTVGSVIGRLKSASGLARFLIIQRSGVTMVEFAIGLSVFVMLLFGVFEVGRLLWTANALHYSTQQAARCASVNTTLCGNGTSATNSQVQTFAAGLAGAGIPTSAFCLNTSCTSPFPTAPANCSSTSFNFVAASYSLSLSIPFLSLSPTVTAESCFPK